jgi:hypothetical protein
VPVFAWGTDAGKTLLSRDKPARQAARVAFYALPAEDTALSNAPPTITLLLYQYRRVATGQTLYSTEAALAKAGYVREVKPVCRVWRTPLRFNPFEVATDWEPVLSSRQRLAAGKNP